MTTGTSSLKGKNLSEIFESAGFLTKDQSAQLASESRASGLKIAEAALEFGFLSEEKLVQAISLQSGFPAMTPEALDPLIHRERLFEHRDVFFRYTAIPLSNGRIVLPDAQAIPQIARDLGVDSFSTSKWCLGPRTYLGFRLTDLLGLSQVDRLGALKNAFFQNPSPPPPRLLEILLETAWGLKASDIHIEPFDRFTRIRARVEGHLRFWASVPREQFEPVGNLVRTQAGLTNRSMMKSHDGEFTFLSGRTEIPVRLSLIPTIYRQFSMVLRLLGSGPGASIVPEILGYSEKTLARIRTVVDQASGITFFTGPTGCHAKGTKILMADGTVTKVEDIRVGEQVMGPDSRPRTVLCLHRGEGRMVRIVPNKGEPFVVNDDHILALRRTSDGSSLDGRILCLPVGEYETKSRTFKHLHKLWRSICDFPEKNLPISPYLLGVYLGDGCSSRTNNRTPVITNPTLEILASVEEELHKTPGMTISISRKGEPTQSYRLKRIEGESENEFVQRLKTLGLFGLKSGEKFIPFEYKTASVNQRLDLLAGLLDTDGHLSGGVYDYITKSERLAEDVVFLARSLGFAAYSHSCNKSCPGRSGTFTGIYFRVSLSGNMTKIPNRLSLKHCSNPRRQKKSVLVTGFRIEEAGYGSYYGFELDGDHLYLTADFMVHHNSGKNTSLHAIFRRILEKHPGKAFVEVADPIEYRLGQGVQAQVWRSETDAWSYAAALKSTLRHDPDIIMVGETRDAETAAIAFDAALTGHLVLSTLHVTEAAGVFDRMARLSVPPADLLSALRVVVNQRLVGRLCPSCKVDVPVPDIPWLFDLAKRRGIDSFKDAGNPSCPACGGLGTLGRYAVAETMTITHEVRRTLSKTGAFGAVTFLETYREIDPEYETLAEMLVDDAASGKTGLSEVLRIVGTVL